MTRHPRIFFYAAAALILGTGFVAVHEAAAAGGFKIDMAFSRLDANSDGRLDRAEVAALHAHRFDRLDASGDGLVTRVEFDAGRAKAANRTGRPVAAAGDGFDRFDADRNGLITRTEFVAEATRAGAIIDADGDGFVSRSEFGRLAAVRAGL